MRLLLTLLLLRNMLLLHLWELRLLVLLRLDLLETRELWLQQQPP